MNIRNVVLRNIALMVVFAAVGLTMFTENVRTVQIVGLLGCGAVLGSASAAIIYTLKSKRTKT